MAEHELDEDKLCEAAIALLSLTLHDDGRVWKGIDWGIMNQLHERGWIADPVGKAKSVVMTPSGRRKALRVLQTQFSTEPKRSPAEAGAPGNDARDDGNLRNAVVIRCTGKLLKELRVKPLPVPSSVPIERDWHATLVRTGRRKSVIVAHSSTLFTALLLHVNRSVIDDFGTRFYDQARCTPAEDGFTRHEAVLPFDSPRILFAKTNNRSVLGSLNELSDLLSAELEDQPEPRGAGFSRICGRLNRVPMIGTLGGAYAVDAMGELLGQKPRARELFDEGLGDAAV